MGLFDWFRRKKRKNETNASEITENVKNTEQLVEDTADNNSAEEAIGNGNAVQSADEVVEPVVVAEEDVLSTENGISDEDSAVQSADDAGATDDNADNDIDEETADSEFVEDVTCNANVTETNDFVSEDTTTQEDVVPVPNDEIQAADEDATEETILSSDTVSENQPYTGRFEINRTKDGKRFFFNLYASNNVGIATSQMYSSAHNALNGVRSVITNAPKAPIEDQTLKTYETLQFPKWEIYIDNGGKYRFRLNASNGSCVCHSQGYTSKANCKNGIESIIRSSRNPEIDKAYLIKKD